MNSPSFRAPTGRGLLAEIEGLRAVAVISVLLYHAHFGFSGGFVGVDVFFVLSGFLITRLLVRERETTGRISLAAFYARRVRRLLPAASLVLLAIVVGSYLLYNPLRAHDTAVDAAWAAGFVANFRFARLGTDYLASSNDPSLIQHWWSLAIEEQFYLVWPGLLAAAWALHRRVASSALVACAVVAVTSFVVGWQLTDSNASWAYFAPWSRGWELAAGGMCAFVFRHRSRVPVRAWLGWIGMAAILVSAVVYDASTPFPGVAALAPVLGTCAVILSIGARRAPGDLLWWGPLQWIGGRSYGIYLWHWPLLVLLEVHYEQSGVAWRAGALIVAIALAAVTYVVLENPVRHLPSLTRSAPRSLLAGLAMVGLVLAATWWSATDTADVRISTGYVAPTVAPTTLPATTVGPPDTTAVEATTTTTTPPDPLEILQQKIASELQPLIAASAANEFLPENITPALSDQHEDRPLPWADGCLVGFFDDTSPPCEYGDLTSDTTIALYGDSHVDQWFPAAEAAAKANHWKLLVISKSKCTILDIPVLYDGTRTYPTCKRWQPTALERVMAPDVKVVVITQWRQHYRVLKDGNARLVRDSDWQAKLTDVVTTLEQAGKQVLLLADSPFAHQSMDECMADHPTSLSRCHFDLASHVVPEELAIEQEVAALTGAEFYDTAPWFCADGTCPVVIGNMAVYLDPHHINNTYGLFLTPYFELLVQHMLRTA